MIFNEARDALRRLRRRPGYSLLSVAILGIGLGLTLFVFNLVHALILTSLPYPHADRLVAIGGIRDAGGGAGDVDVGIAKPLALGLLPEDLRRWVWLMFGACATVLLLACVNVANLQLVQMLRRRRELALRSALGSHPRRLTAGALCESLWL